MKIYNTMSKKKEEFIPLEEGKVRMYVCGPTVYNFIHIGNARPMIVFDTVRRYFEYKGYDVNYVSNFTDVDDKIIAKANEEGVTAEEISQRYIEECKKDMAGMNVKPATTNPLATQEIDGMKRTVLFTTEPASSKSTVNCPTRIWMIFVPESAHFLYLVQMRRKIHWISFSGNRKKKENHSGNPHGVTDVRGGIQSVLRCPRNILESR